SESWPRRVAMTLAPGKSELIDFMVTDLEESIVSLRETAPKLCDKGARQDAALELAELTEGVSRTVEFFEFEQLGTLVDSLHLFAERVSDLSEEQVAQALPRVMAITQLVAEQSDGLKIGEVVTYDISELCARLVDLALGHELLPEYRVAADTPIDEVFRVDQVHGAIHSTTDDAPAGAAPAAEAVAEVSSAGARPDESSPSPAGPDGSDSAASAQTSGPAKVEQTIRVEVSRLEALLNLVGELVIQKNRVGALSRSIVSAEAVTQDMREAISQGSSDLDRITGDIQVAVMRTRMQPLDKIFGKYPRLIRDLARKTGKEMQLVVEGGDVEVDKSVIEELGDPLVHLMRNSADHGIELPEARQAAGKDPKGTIRLKAVHEGSHVVIQMIDDGAGLSREKLLKKAIERGLTTEEDAAQLSDREVYRFIMAAGFSTATQVSDISGRGVGMDVVRTNIEALKGTIDVDSTPGQGTTITIKIPLTVAIMPAMMVGVGGEQYAIPLSSILEIVMPESEQISTVHGRRVMRLRDSVLPLVSVSELFDVPRTGRPAGKFAVVVELNDQIAGLTVEQLIGQQEVVVKPLDDDIAGDGLLSGATVRDDGGVSLIVDIGRMISSAATHDRALIARQSN
ncbi:MAG: chemotaxis protein CheA, partial [Phycisphaeraceae bacterium]|nr:chemotaxis protein CheA [Phycisphaeraceae bacterium]